MAAFVLCFVVVLDGLLLQGVLHFELELHGNPVAFAVAPQQPVLSSDISFEEFGQFAKMQ